MFADIDCYDIELNAKKQEMISACRMFEPTFGGINLEDIKVQNVLKLKKD